jgi:hypothetical protein
MKPSMTFFADSIRLGFISSASIDLDISSANTISIQFIDSCLSILYDHGHEIITENNMIIAIFIRIFKEYI